MVIYGKLSYTKYKQSVKIEMFYLIKKNWSIIEAKQSVVTHKQDWSFQLFLAATKKAS